jgi:hypothetical protein
MRFSIIEFGGGSFGVYCAGRRHPITGLPSSSGERSMKSSHGGGRSEARQPFFLTLHRPQKLLDF